VLYIPADFSEAATSAGTDHPRHPQLTLEINQGRNMLGAQYVRSITTEMRRQISLQFSTRYLQTLFDQVLNGGQGLSQAAQGAQRLADGSGRAYAGARSLADSLAKADSGMTGLAGGLSALQSGNRDLQNGVSRLNTLISSLTAGGGTTSVNWGSMVDDLKRSAGEAAAARKRLSTASQTLQVEQAASDNALAAAQRAAGTIDNAGASTGPLRDAVAAENARFAEANGALADFLQAHPNLSAQETAALQRSMRRLGSATANVSRRAEEQSAAVDAATGAMSGALGSLAASQARSSQAAAQVSAEADSLAAAGGSALQRASAQAGSITQLPARMRDLTAGLRALSSGADRLSGGVSSLSAGFNSARAGVTRLSGGAAQLAPALMKIRDGQRELAGKLAEAAALSSKDAHAKERIAVIADPLRISEVNRHPVPNNGTGFAPYFIALSLWFGSIMLFFVVDIHKVHASGSYPISYFVSKYVALASVSLAQAVICMFVLHTALGLTTRLPAIQLYTLAIITGLSFSAILFLLIGVLGSNLGRFVSVIVLMLQLTSSGGSYPVEMTPAFIRFLHPYLPMTYAVEGFRQVISVGNGAVLVHDMFVLACFGVGSLLLLYMLKRKSIARDIREAASPA
jgi:putative membrane protein